jgi:hypothetical protein
MPGQPSFSEISALLSSVISVPTAGKSEKKEDSMNSSKLHKINRGKEIVYQAIPVVVILFTAIFSPVLSIRPVNACSISVISNDIENEIVLDISVNPAEVELQELPADNSIAVQIPDASNIRPYGYPRLPAISRFIQISNTKNVEADYEILESSTQSLHAPLSLSDGKDLMDAKLPVTSPVLGSLRHQPIYPESQILIGKPAILRNLRIVQVTFYPVQWDRRNNALIFTWHARIHVNLSGISKENVLEEPSKVFSPAFDAFYKGVVLNYKATNDLRTGEAEPYLIIYPNSYESRLQSFISWKEDEGYSIELLRLSTLGTSPTADALKAAIQTYYSSGSPPVYVLIIGDENATPIYYSYDSTHPGDYADDLYYSTLAGDDFLPDVFLARLPAQSPIEFGTMIDKILRYEVSPQMDNLQFYKTALMAASALEDSQIDTKVQTADRLTEFCSYDTIRTYYTWDESSVDSIISDINQGVSIINYRGEGWRKGWNPLHLYWFECDDVYTLRNFNLTPFITSIGCGVCLFDTEDDCFAHAMMALGSSSVSMGAVGIIGPTWNTHTTFNNWLDRGMYRGYVYWDIYQAGSMMDYGKMYMLEQFPEPENEVYNEIEFRTFLCFGTPDMWIRTGVPSNPVVGLAYGNDSMQRFISVRDDSGNVVDSGLVSFSANGQRWVLPTDENGGVATGLSLVPGNAVDVVVSGKNQIPHHSILPWSTGTTGTILITELKPDIPTDGTQGDKIELYNADTHAIDLQGWIVTDMDGYDIPFVSSSCLLNARQLAVVEFVGPQGTESVSHTAYGLYIRSVAVPDFSSLEGVASLRDARGHIVDSLAWQNRSGSASSNCAIDMSKLTAPTSPITVDSGGWWTGPDTVGQDTFEANAIDWSPFEGMGGDGSMQRCSESFPDGPGNFTTQVQTGFGSYWHSNANNQVSRNLEKPE